MKAKAQHKRRRAPQSEPVKGQTTAPSGSGRVADSMLSLVTESSGDLSWVEFCSKLSRPAFLLAVTGFGEL